MSSYVELQRARGVGKSLRIALPDDITRDIAFRQDGGWVAALHNALISHRPRGGELFAEALDAGRDAATVLFEMPARSEGDPPIQVVRWTDEAPLATRADFVPPAQRMRLSKPTVV